VRDHCIRDDFTHKQIRNFLNFLRDTEHHNFLPKSVATLFKLKNVKMNLSKVPPGEYIHFSLRESINVKDYPFLNSVPTIRIDICIDGVPLVKSSKLVLWPILGNFCDNSTLHPFLIGCYVGYGGPNSINDYLGSLIDEVLIINENNGIEISGKTIPLEIRAFTCDAPARSFLAGTMYPTALRGCSKCNQVGRKESNYLIFQAKRGDLRSDLGFNLRLDPLYHHKEFLFENVPLELIDIGLVSQIPLEPMHLLDMGVTKRMMRLFVENKGNRYFRTKKILKETEDHYILIAAFVPVEFVRQPRDFAEICRYKSTEFRMILMYVGPVIFLERLNPEAFKLFMRLHCAVRLLYLAENYILAEKLLDEFVTNFESAFDKNYRSYNIHSLLHILQDAKTYVLTTISNYKFENFMQILKNKIKSPTNVPRQIANARAMGKFPKIASSKFDKIIINPQVRNNHCVLKNGNVVKVVWADKEGTSARGQVYKSHSDFYNSDFCSCQSLTGYILDPAELTEELVDFSLTGDVRSKLFRMPWKQKFVALPLIHHDLK
jgi:hypothetical protein